MIYNFNNSSMITQNGALYLDYHFHMYFLQSLAEAFCLGMFASVSLVLAYKLVSEFIDEYKEKSKGRS